jgi:hypothetical protein
MKKLKRFWRTFEEPYGVRGVRAHWRGLLGAELAVASPFLRKLKEPSATYPCPRRGGDGCPRRVVVHGPEDIRAVCGCAPKECDPVRLKPEDIVVYELDPKRFCGFLSESLGLAAVAEPVGPRSDIWHVGSWAAGAADRQPVFLVAAPGRSAFDGAIGALLIAFQGPFVVLAPTLRFSGATAAEGLRQRGAALLTLEDVVLRSDENNLVAAAPLPELMANGRRGQPAVTEETRNVFRREQDFWLLSFTGKTIRLRHLAGLGYIAEMLRAPGKTIEALALVGAPGDGKAPVPAGGAIEMADEQAIRAVRTALQEREEELARLPKNDWNRRGSMTEEIEKLRRYLQENQGLGGRSRKVTGPAEKARKAVSAAVTRAFTEIQAHHPELAAHLKSSVELGSTLLYHPESDPGWEF